MNRNVENRIHENFPKYIEALKQLVRIPSISFDNFDQKFVMDSAEAVKAMFAEAGFTNIQFLLPPSGRPTVYAESLTSADKPTILLYAHHDVQPPMREALWKSAPFEPEVYRIIANKISCPHDKGRSHSRRRKDSCQETG